MMLTKLSNLLSKALSCAHSGLVPTTIIYKAVCSLIASCFLQVMILDDINVHFYFSVEYFVA